MKNILLLLVSTTLIANTLFAQVIINEYSASNLAQFVDANGKYEDWIELYNVSGVSVDIGGMYLSDRLSKPTKWMIPVGTSVPAFGHLLFWCSGRDTLLMGQYHTSFKLSQTTGRDSVLLSSPSGNIIESWPLTTTQVENSLCRETDGSGIWKFCTTPTPGTANNGSSQINGYALPVAMSLTAGFYTGTQTVSIATFEPNSVIRYSTNGNAPTLADNIYSTPISISANTVLKATVFSNDPLIFPSLPATNTYFIDENISLAVMSIGADQVQDLANGTGTIKPVGSIEYFDINGIRMAESYGTLNRHGQDSWVLDQRSIDWVSRDEMGHSKSINAQLFNYSPRNQFQRIIMRASGDDNYPAINDGDHDGACHIRDEYVHILAQKGGMKLDVRAVERIVVFLNGDYWGVYGMRERPVDHDYIKEYYGHGKYELQFLSTWGATEAEYGGQQAFADWYQLRTFILNNDMSIAANYQYVDDNLRLTSLCDYMIANLNSVASDWLNYNTGWYRGLNPTGNHKKWGYILWDNDATFDYYINYSGVPNTNPDAEPCDIDDIGDYMDQFFSGGFFADSAVGMHEKIFEKLQNENE
ncbi:MAG: chitobiase/beta-hexosaminidase C-terminal domain-containing protein, partial [Flavobacteriales bacterium]|nr:chitobiase/beta-hexosaminidase C-terminal domain-containing protein [Flavobacteriales bacterium]